MLKRIALMLSFIISVFACLSAYCQGGPGGDMGGMGGGMGGMGGGMDMMGGMGGMTGRGGTSLDTIKTQLNCTDDEWAVIQPKLQAVITAKQATQTTSGRGMGMMGMGGTATGTNTSNTQQAVTKAMTELQTLLNDEKSPSSEITSKLKTYRDLRIKAEKELATAQKTLAEVLTPRQEAILVNMGYLK
jgi:Spy/CpxP family protein refolding chaperone